jgi:hypothetical protein
MGFVLIVAALTLTFSRCDNAVWQNLEGRSLLVEKGGSNLKRPNPFPRYRRIAKLCNFSVQKKYIKCPPSKLCQMAVSCEQFQKFQ